MVLLDKRGTITAVNADAREWLHGQLVGEAWRDVYQRELRRSAQGNELLTRCQRMLDVSTRPLEGSTGQIVLLSDVTESRAMQQSVERDRRLAAIGEMMARLSHQIRTPIATALLYLTQMDDQRLDRERRSAYVNKSLGRLRHVESMIRDMLMFAHGAHMETEYLDVDDILADLQQQLEPLIESCGGSFSISNRASRAVRGNRVGLVTALLNLCNNAIEHVGAALELSICVYDRGADSLQIEVGDNGPGIDADLHERVFQPFYTSRSDGTGLGLPVVKSIVLAHGGTVTVGGCDRGGCRISMTLPTHEPPLHSPLDCHAQSRHEVVGDSTADMRICV